LSFFFVSQNPLAEYSKPSKGKTYSVDRVVLQGLPPPPHQTVGAVFPHTAFRYSSSFSIQPQILASPAS